jgi:hypothetical protein
MNVLNVADIERELRRYAARCVHEPASRWVMSVARNHIISKLPEKDVNANYRLLTDDERFEKEDSAYKYFPAASLPAWAVSSLAAGQLIYWFDPIQVRRRNLWQCLDIIVIWFNSLKPTDTRLRRLDRIAFPVAVDASILWYKDVSENVWNYVTDKPVTIFRYDDHISWVKLVSTLQFEREGRLMNHCIGNGTYFNRFRTAENYDYYSLRDLHNKPHVTLEVHDGGIIQCKGKNNNRPSAEYQPYIKHIIDHKKWTVVSDSHHIDANCCRPVSASS